METAALIVLTVVGLIVLVKHAIPAIRAARDALDNFGKADGS